jgi:glycosyltransferase involved in cell wall biosynthesis
LHRIVVIHSHGWCDDRLVYTVNKGLRIPWLIDLRLHSLECSQNRDRDPEFERLVAPLLAVARGAFYTHTDDLLVFSKWSVPRPRHLARLVDCFDPSVIRREGNRPDRSGARDFVFAVAPSRIPHAGWQEAIEAVQRINSLSSEDRGERHVRLVLIRANLALNVHAAWADIDRAVEIRGPAHHLSEFLFDCDALLFLDRAASRESISALMECLACGLPVVTVEGGLIDELVIQNGRHAGITVPDSAGSAIDVDSLACAMLRYMEQTDLHEQHKLNTISVFDSNFHCGRVAAQAADAYAAAMSTPEFSEGSRHIADPFDGPEKVGTLRTA